MLCNCSDYLCIVEFRTFRTRPSSRPPPTTCQWSRYSIRTRRLRPIRSGTEVRTPTPKRATLTRRRRHGSALCRFYPLFCCLRLPSLDFLPEAHRRCLLYVSPLLQLRGIRLRFYVRGAQRFSLLLPPLYIRVVENEVKRVREQHVRDFRNYTGTTSSSPPPTSRLLEQFKN